MGKSIIILGADFSANGLQVSQKFGTDEVFSNAVAAALGNYTWIFNETSKVSGKVVKVKAYLLQGGSFKVKVFKPDFTLRDEIELTTDISDEFVEFNTSLEVEKGDYIAYYGSDSGAKIPYTAASGTNIYYVPRDASSINLNNFNQTAHTIQIYLEI